MIMIMIQIQEGKIRINQNNEQAKMKLKTVDQLLLHNTDTAVNPIIGKEVEELPELVYNKQLLPFNTKYKDLTPEEVANNIDSNDIETFLTEIYQAIAANGTTKDKINVLTYFESLITTSVTANKLINSNFVILLLKMLSQAKSPILKMRLCSILGQLIRHATVIQNDLAESDICSVLCEACDNEVDEVKRRAIAALGEYLFYAATQLDKKNANPVWFITPEAVETVFHQLSLDTDEVTKYYATRTIENITAQSLSGGILLATLDIAIALLGIYNSTQNEGLKISAAVSISYVCKLNLDIFPTIFESISCYSFCTVLCEGPPRIQQAFIIMLNIALMNPYPKLNDVLMEESKFKEAMSYLIENSNEVIKGKCILTILLLFKMDPHWIILVDEFKFYTILDRMSRDYSKYIQYCLLCLIDGVLELIPKILGIIKKDFTKYTKDPKCFDVLEDTVINKIMKEATKKIKTCKSEHLPEGMVLIIAIYDLLKSQLFKNKIICKDLIVLIGLILEKTEGMESDTVYEIRNYNLLILENLCTNQKAIIKHNKAIVDHILPCLITRIQSSDPETKFSCLKSFTDLITQYLGDDKIYDADGTQEATKKINEMIIERLFPHYENILNDDNPLPLFGLKLLCAIVERNSAFVTILKKLKLVDIMMEYFTDDHPRFNTHLIKIVCCIVESKELKLEELQEYDLVNKLNKALTNAIDGEGDSFLDHLLDIVYELLHYVAETIKDSETKVAEETFEGLVKENFEICANLLGSPNISIIEKASQNLIDFIHISAMIKKDESKVNFYSRHLPSMIKALERNKITVNKRVLKCIFWGLNQPKTTLELNDTEKGILKKIVEENVDVNDGELKTTANELKKLLE